MASFEITAYTYASVTLSISDLTTGGFVRIIVRLTDDVDDRTGDVTFTATAASTEKTITGLSGGKDYTVNVKHGAASDGSDAEWIGAQTFTTPASPGVIGNKIVKLPLLDSSYTLFSWADYPNSYAALYSGGLTSDFEKECWNAIVDKTVQVFADSGLTWDATYTTAAAAQITEAYGALYAKMFNSVAHNINFPVPLGWVWAKGSAFRGYIGREVFRGVEAYGANADDLYPEYITELVRRLNVFIRVLKDEITASAAGKEWSTTQSESGLRVKPSLPLPGTQQIVKSSYSAAPRTAYAAKTQGVEQSFSSHETVARSRGVAKTLAKKRSFTASDTAANTAPSLQFAARKKSASMHEALILSGIPVELTLESIAQSTDDLQLRPTDTLLLTGGGIAQSSDALTLTQNEPVHIIGADVSLSIGAAGITQRGAAAVRPEALSQTAYTPGIRAAETAGVATQSASATPGSCRLASAWYPPIWVNGGLWIRQSHGVTQNDNGELVIT